MNESLFNEGERDRLTLVSKIGMQYITRIMVEMDSKFVSETSRTLRGPGSNSEVTSTSIAKSIE